MLLLLMNMLSRVVTFSLPVSACRLQTVVVRTDSITNIARRFVIPTLWHNIFLKQVKVVFVVVDDGIVCSGFCYVIWYTEYIYVDQIYIPRYILWLFGLTCVMYSYETPKENFLFSSSQFVFIWILCIFSVLIYDLFCVRLILVLIENLFEYTRMVR